MLGSYVDSKLVWHEQIIDVSKNAGRSLGLFRKFRKRYFVSDLYKAYIRPLQEYDRHVWAGASAVLMVSSAEFKIVIYILIIRNRID